MKATIFSSLTACLLATFLASPTTALANPPAGPFYGPAGGLHLNTSRIAFLVVKPGQTVTLRFQANAVHENAIMIYDYTGKRLATRGNYNRSLANYTWRNGFSSNVTIYITGWNKAGRPNGSLPWRQSPLKIFSSLGTHGVFGFDDMGAVGRDYNDMVVNWSIR